MCWGVRRPTEGDCPNNCKTKGAGRASYAEIKGFSRQIGPHSTYFVYKVCETSHSEALAAHKQGSA